MESSLSQVRRMAMLDPLTGLLNRRALGEFAHQALYGEPGETEPVTVVVIDCDGFKELNDTYGHTAGDHVLQMLARTLQYETRKNDLVARIGGDEFVVVLRGTTAAEAKSIMERVEALFETHVRNAGYACTISVGYSPSSDQTESIEALMEQADRAMYARKERKRSRAYLR
jgi:diguanylate cyclase (GGDEF)-like protein